MVAEFTPQMLFSKYHKWAAFNSKKIHEHLFFSSQVPEKGKQTTQAHKTKLRYVHCLSLCKKMTASFNSNTLTKQRKNRSFKRSSSENQYSAKKFVQRKLSNHWQLLQWNSLHFKCMKKGIPTKKYPWNHPWSPYGTPLMERQTSPKVGRRALMTGSI